jgi:ribosomal peptide maturation radical SAM protein 1
MWCTTSSGQDTSGASFRVALVCMPFYLIARPAIQLGLLQSIAEQAGFAADSYHLNLNLASLLGSTIYEEMSCNRESMMCEWLFSSAAFGDSVPDDEAYYEAFPQVGCWAAEIGKDLSYLSHLRHTVIPSFITDCVEQIPWETYQVVGFSSSYQQNVASLALARQIKAQFPQVQILFGGANMDGQMGPAYAKAFPFIDYIVVGEGDRVFPTLLHALATYESTEKLEGLVQRKDGNVIFTGSAPLFRELDQLPVPNYDDYFHRVRTLGLHHQKGFSWSIPFESSRGCWWGQRHHCTFCGLNGNNIHYRAKSSAHVEAELAELAKKYYITSFQAMDNIFDMKYIKDFFVPIREAKIDYQFVYETKSNLTASQIHALYQGGVRVVQPGIESLSTHVLHLMNKGCTMLQNVRFLKWARYYNVRTNWNLLWGFPRETKEDYQQQLAVLKLLSHLDPPMGFGRIWLERFSPYFEQTGISPFKNVRPQKSYSYVYPPSLPLEEIAYFFDYSVEDTLEDKEYQPTIDWVKEWQRRWCSPSPDTLFYRRTPDCLFIDDNRGVERRGTHVFEGAVAHIFELCGETALTAKQVQEQLAATPTPYQCHYDVNDIIRTLDHFCQLGLMLNEDDRYLGLALPANPNW